MSQPTDQGATSQAPGASAPGASLLPDSTDLFTYTHLAFLALFALVVVAGIVFGVRLARRRRQAMKEVQADNALIGEVPAPPATHDGTVPAPVATPVTPPPAPIAAAGDDPAAGPVTQLKGLGPKLAARLGELGVTAVGQLAALSDDDAAALDAQLGPFAGRLTRDRWQEQARFLAAGDRQGFESVFGRL